MPFIQYKAVIVDDDPESRNNIEKLLTNFDEFKIAGSVGNAEKAIFLVIKEKPNIIFLDIDLQDNAAFYIIKRLKKINIRANIIVLAEKNDFAIETIKDSIFDCLFKPVKINGLKETLEKYKKKELQHQLLLKAESWFENLINPSKIKFNIRTGTIYINPNEIVFCEASGNYSVLHITHQKKEVVTAKIGKVEEILVSEKFIRLGRSIIININYLSKVDRKKRMVILEKDDQEFEINVSLKYIKVLS